MYYELILLGTVRVISNTFRKTKTRTMDSTNVLRILKLVYLSVPVPESWERLTLYRVSNKYITQKL